MSNPIGKLFRRDAANASNTPSVPRKPPQDAARPAVGILTQKKAFGEGDVVSQPKVATRQEVATVAPTIQAVRPRPRADEGDVDSGRQASSAGGGRSFAFVPAVEATEADIAVITEFAGEVLTVSGALETSAKQRQQCAFLDNGWLLVDKSNPNNPAVLQVQHDLRNKLRRPIARKITVDLSVIRKVNEKGGRGFGARVDTVVSGIEQQEFQKEFIALITDAAKRRVSDVHVIVDVHEAKIEFRQNGIIVPIYEKPADWGRSLCQAAFSMASDSDPVYKALEYQGARVSNVRTTNLPPGTQSIRLQFNPLPSGGRNMVCRLLYENSNAGNTGGVGALGYSAAHIFNINRMRKRAYGINVIAGPTGSGKSTTLVRVLTTLMSEKRGIKVLTIEDPPEYVIPGAVQLPVVNAANEDERKEKFRQAIAGALRSDPDVIMIGEIRDGASGHLAFTAASTGHQVYASLHANNALAILTRLRDIGVPVYNLTDADIMTGLIGQRLIRRLCPHCKIPVSEITPELRAAVGDEVIDQARSIAANYGEIHIARPGGCSKCDNGIAGREVIAETVNPDETYMQLFKEHKTVAAQKHWLDNLNGLSMAEHAVQKMVRGLADPRDVEEVTGDLHLFDMNRQSIVFGKLFERAA